MKMLIASALGVMLLGGCAEEKTTEVSTSDTTTTTAAATQTVAPIEQGTPIGVRSSLSWGTSAVGATVARAVLRLSAGP